MRFKDILGFEEEKQALRRMVDTGEVPHAVMLHGKEGIGKTLLARAFIQYLFCTARVEGDSCGVCPACRQTSALNNPDIHYVYPVTKAGGRSHPVSLDFLDQWRDMLRLHPYMTPKEWMRLLDCGNSQPLIYVDEADDIARVASLSPFGADKKVFLIWQPEKMNVQTANKLLKLIEEPYEDTIFVMVSNDPASILPTVLSRTRRLEVATPPAQEVSTVLQKHGVPQFEADKLARISEGNIAHALELAEQGGEVEQFNRDFQQAMRMAYTWNIPALRDLSDSLSGYGREKSIRLLEYFARMARENFIYNLSVPALSVMMPEEEAFSHRFAPFIHAGNIELIIREIDEGIRDISRNANAKLVWFDLLLRLMRMLRIPRK